MYQGMPACPPVEPAMHVQVFELQDQLHGQQQRIQELQHQLAEAGGADTSPSMQVLMCHNFFINRQTLAQCLLCVSSGAHHAGSICCLSPHARAYCKAASLVTDACGVSATLALPGAQYIDMQYLAVILCKVRGHAANEGVGPARTNLPYACLYRQGAQLAFWSSE